MNLPLAVSPGILTPGLYLVVDLLAGASAPGGGVLRVALLASKSAAGNLTNDTEVRAGAGEPSASRAFGPGTPGHLAAKLLYKKFPGAQVDFIAPTPGAGTATLPITFAGAPSQNTSALADIAGREFELAWLVGETPTDMQAKLIAAIAQRTSDLPVAGAAGSTGVVNINGKVTGRVSNDIQVRVILSQAQTGTETITGAAVYTKLSGGSADPDITNALTSIKGQEYAFILPVLSNTDAGNTSTKSNVSRLVDHVNALNTGLGAKLQQIVVGITSTVSAAKAASAAANGAQNDETVELILCVNGRGLPGELAGREVGGQLAGLSLDPAVNRIGELMDGYIGAKDKIADKPALSASEDALGNGVALVSYTSQGLEQLVRPITTHSQDSAGGPDRRLLDTQNVSATYIIARDLREALPQQFPNAKIIRDIAPGDEPPPANVIEERDVKSFIVSRLRFWQRKGVLTKQSLDTALADGSLVVQVDDSDESQVDIVLPFKIVPPLAKFGVVVQRVPN